MDNRTLSLMMGAAGGASKLYVEDVFSTWLYTGNGSTQTITNGIDLSGKGGLVWIKRRGPGSGQNALFDTARGANNYLRSNGTGAQNDFGTYSDTLTAFSGTGFSLGADASLQAINSVTGPGDTYASWTFRKEPGFFDVVTYTGTGANRTVAHSLGSVPGTIIVKRTNAVADWQVYHRSLANTEYLVLNSTAAKATGATRWNSTTPTSTEFSLGTDTTVNANGGTYVAYLFAHDAGGFGDSGNESVVRCGSFTTDSNGAATVDLGWEPQFVLVKSSTSDLVEWFLFDSLRGFVVLDSGSRVLSPNYSFAEYGSGARFAPTSTGFTLRGGLGNSQTSIYIAIRRGPMKTPTDATKVFTAIARAGTSATATVSAGFSTDMALIAVRSSCNPVAFDRLRGATRYLNTTTTLAETTDAATLTGFDSNSGVVLGADAASGYVNSSGNYINWFFRRAPGFFDVVAYTGTSNSLPQTISHNLGVKPEMMIVKRRDATSSYGWHVWHSTYEVVGGSTSQHALLLNTTGAIASDAGWWNQTSPTSAGFTVGDRANMLNATFIAYLFASCPGVSKVGSYTGTGTTLSVDCGFTNGARFVLIKRTDSTGDWYIWDTARGIIAANDPYLLLNSNAAEVTSTDYIDPLSAGFQISSTAPAAINASGGTFIFLAIA